MKQNSNPLDSVPSWKYDEEYFQSCQGYDQFLNTKGDKLPRRLSRPLEIANIQPGMRILDIGCGRGEVILHACNTGAYVLGFDYSRYALLIAKANLDQSLTNELRANILLYQSNAQFLGVADNTFDRVFMLDIVEHLYPEELASALEEVKRVLRPGGQLIIHTMPNLWYYRIGYPIYRIVQWMRGKHMPKDPRDRWPSKEVHVNEQTPKRLKKVLSQQGFYAKVWLETTQSYSDEPNKFIRWCMNFITRQYPFRVAFCNDIFAIGIKPQ